MNKTPDRLRVRVCKKCGYNGLVSISWPRCVSCEFESVEYVPAADAEREKANADFFHREKRELAAAFDEQAAQLIALREAGERLWRYEAKYGTGPPDENRGRYLAALRAALDREAGDG